MQLMMSLSMTEVKYRVLADTSKDILYFKKNWTPSAHFNSHPKRQLVLHKLVDNPILHSRTKHIGRQYHFICEVLQVGSVQVKHVSTKDQEGDFITKLLYHSNFVSNKALLEFDFF